MISQNCIRWRLSEIMRMKHIIAFVALILAAPIFAQEFDPSKVRSVTCESGEFDCGFTPPTKAEYEAIPLADSTQVAHRGLPTKADLSPQMPPIGSQGQQNSCVAWATGYAVRSYQENKERKWGFDPPFAGGSGTKVFSPSYIYNQINGGQDKGSVIENALALTINQGTATWQAMPYTDKDYKKQPSTAQKSAAASFKTRSYRRIPSEDLNALKAEIAGGNPIIFGMGIDDAFYNLNDKKSKVYDETYGQFYGGHAMVLVGYDDAKVSDKGHKGAFKIFNSWGKGWGENGYGWVSYKQWVAGQPWSYVLYDKVDSNGDDIPPSSETEIEQTDEGANLSPPAQVAASKGSFSDKVVINWSKVNGAIVYLVIRSVASGNDYDVIGNTTELTYSDTAIQQDVAYKYRVVAAATETNYSDPNLSPEAQGYAKKSATASKPGKVLGLRGVASQGGIDLTWTPTASADKYSIARWDPSRKVWRALSSSTTNSFTDTNPIANTKNAYAISAANGAGQGAWSDSVSVAVAGKTERPSAPSQLSATMGQYKNKIILNWKGVPGAKKYIIYRYDYGSEKWVGPYASNSTTYTDSGSAVASGETFAYSVAAQNEAGLGEYSEYAYGKANPNAARAGLIDAPKNLSGTVNQNAKTVTLTWSPVAKAAEYYIYRKKKDSTDDGYVATIPKGKTSYSEKIPTDDGALYFYTVTAKDEYGESAKSNSAPAFINAKREVVKQRFIPGEGLERFVGQWKSRYWDGKGAPVNVTIDLTSQGAKFTGVLKFGSSTKTFTGTYATGSDSIEVDGLTMILYPAQDLAVVETDSALLSPQEFKLSFTKQ